MEIEIALIGEKLFDFAGLSITNTFFLSVICSILILSGAFYFFRKKELLPQGGQNFFEFLLESIFNFIDSITGDRKKTEEIFPLSATLFIIVLLSNLIEIIPGLGVFHFLRSPSSDVHFTLALAIFSVAFIHISALKQLGFFSYFKKFINFSSPIMFFVGILEGIGEFTKLFSLAVRLFGNLFAGEVLLIIVCSMMPFLLPLPFLGMELFVGFIQALIFSSLVSIFYVFTTTKQEH